MVAGAAVVQRSTGWPGCASTSAAGVPGAPHFFTVWMVADVGTSISSFRPSFGWRWPSGKAATGPTLRRSPSVVVETTVPRSSSVTGVPGVRPELDLPGLGRECERALGREDVDALVRATRPRLAEVVDVDGRAEDREHDRVRRLLRPRGGLPDQEGHEEGERESEGPSGCRPERNHGRPKDGTLADRAGEHVLARPGPENAVGRRCTSPPEPGFARWRLAATKPLPARRAGGSGYLGELICALKEGAHGGTRGSPVL